MADPKREYPEDPSDYLGLSNDDLANNFTPGLPHRSAKRKALR